MLEHIPRPPRLRPTRLPIVVFALLLAIPVGLSAIHGYDSTRVTHQIATGDREQQDHDTSPRQRLVLTQEDALAPPREPRRNAISEQIRETPLTIVRRWLNLPG